MTKLIILVALMFIVTGCKSQGSNKLVLTSGVIEVFKARPQGDTVCVKKTKSRIRRCKHWRDDESCFEPGATITWNWKGNVDQTFEIVAKDSFQSPFVLGDSACEDKANTVVCTIREDIDLKNTFFDYSVIVDAGNETCNLDPRILIY